MIEQSVYVTNFNFDQPLLICLLIFSLRIKLKVFENRLRIDSIFFRGCKGEK